MKKEVALDKIVSSLARFISGLKPKHGNSYYFSRSKSGEILSRKLINFRGTKICPFCKARFSTKSSISQHIENVHRRDIERELNEIEIHISRIRKKYHDII